MASSMQFLPYIHVFRVMQDCRHDDGSGSTDFTVIHQSWYG